MGKEDRKQKKGLEYSGAEAELLEQRKAMLVSLMNEEAYVPMKLKELAILLNVPKEQREELKQVLNLLLAEGKISVSKKGKFGKAEAFALVGVFSGNARGFGFVAIEGQEEDVFIPADRTGGALHGDRVQIVIDSEGRGGRPEGTVVRILEHANETLVGTYEKGKGYGFVIPDNQRISKDIFIPQGCSQGAVSGHKVMVRIKDFGEKKGKKPEGVITEILGHIHDPGVDILSIVRAYGLPEDFPGAVKTQLKQIPDEVKKDSWAGRKDLRDLLTVTIDGEEAKDLDDAISIERAGEGYRLGVHIADVSHYVQEHTPLDEEAFKRGTSVYLVDRVIPMLPHQLSNGICSLNEGEDRLALSCLMEIDSQGNVTGHEIAETVIRSDRRMTYTAVNAIVTDHDPQVTAEYAEFAEMFLLMKELADILRKKRHARGSIDFDFPESKIILNAAGKAIDVKPYEANVATKIIEDFMLMANETVAQEYCTEEIPFVYRTHDNPDPEKVESLLTLLHNQGVKIQKAKEEITPKEIQQIIESIEGLPNEAMISRLVLRSMKQAKYTTECSGHFGLAAKYYCHFTSPIRRYPDLQIHRIIKDNLRGRLMREGRTEHYAEILDEVARQSSVCERRADEAERESDKLKKAEYMSYHLGEEFEGIISGVTGWGLYVELPNTVEGLVHVNTLRDDYYIFDQETYELRGEMTKKVYKLGDKVCVRVADADKMLKTVDFELVADIWNDEEEN